MWILCNTEKCTNTLLRAVRPCLVSSQARFLNRK
uniref:Uncharacterized protein n=1 Tax=Anguilla anguilla TaxID=7936 RepID=A0A0E9VUA2_ANGAN